MVLEHMFHKFFTVTPIFKNKETFEEVSLYVGALGLGFVTLSMYKKHLMLYNPRHSKMREICFVVEIVDSHVIEPIQMSLIYFLNRDNISCRKIFILSGTYYVGRLFSYYGQNMPEFNKYKRYGEIMALSSIFISSVIIIFNSQLKRYIWSKLQNNFLIAILDNTLYYFNNK